MVLSGRLLPYLENIRLSWKSLPGTNALAYYKNSLLMAIKHFYNICPRLKINFKTLTQSYKTSFTDKKL